MRTTWWHVQGESFNHQAIEEAAQLIKQGELVAFPTETVYGLGADATNEAAVAKIFIAKGRPQDNPLIVHVANKAQMKQLVTTIPSYVERMLEVFSPGPITYVLPSNGKCANNVTAGLSTVAVRIPDHPIARQLLLTCQLPIAAPSANRSGKPSPTTAEHVWEDLNGRIAGLLDGGKTGVGMESTVVDCTGDVPVILRPGGVTREQLEQVVDKMNMTQLDNETIQHQPTSPGMKYKHYSPEVPLWIVEGGKEHIQKVINDEQAQGKKVGVLASAAMIANLQADKKVSLGNELHDIALNLYEGLRTFRRQEVDLIICESFPERDIGAAIMNRLHKAASKRIS